MDAVRNERAAGPGVALQDRRQDSHGSGGSAASTRLGRRGRRVSAVVVAFRHPAPVIARAPPSARAPDRTAARGDPRRQRLRPASRAPARDAGLDVRVLRPVANLGYVAACNLAAREAEGGWLWFVNPDAVPAPPALERLLDAADAGHRLGRRPDPASRRPLQRRRQRSARVRTVVERSLRGTSGGRAAARCRGGLRRMPARAPRRLRAARRLSRRLLSLPRRRRPGMARPLGRPHRAVRAPRHRCARLRVREGRVQVVLARAQPTLDSSVGLRRPYARGARPDPDRYRDWDPGLCAAGGLVEGEAAQLDNALA